MEENKIKISQLKDFMVIGLGRFGKTIAKSLSENGKEVVAIDIDPEIIKTVQSEVSSAVVANALGTDVLKSLGIENFDCVVVGIGSDIQSSILITLTCKELGIPYIVAKAKNDQHKKILEKIGADLVIVPEYFMAKKVASMLANPNVYEVMKLTDEFKIIEIKTPPKWQNKSIIELDLKKKYQVIINFIKTGEEIITPHGETVLHEGDILVIAGDVSNLNKVLNKIDDPIDIEDSITGNYSTAVEGD